MAANAAARWRRAGELGIRLRTEPKDLAAEAKDGRIMQKAIADPDHPASPSRVGASAFRWSRITAVALIVLVPYALYTLARLAGSDLATTRQILGLPLNALALLALVVIGAAHMRLGMSEILEDYLRGPSLHFWQMVNSVFCLVIVLAAGGGIIKLWLGA